MDKLVLESSNGVDSISRVKFSETTQYFAPSPRDVMINYRVENLADLVEQLKRGGVIIVDKIITGRTK